MASTHSVRRFLARASIAAIALNMSFTGLVLSIPVAEAAAKNTTTVLTAPSSSTFGSSFNVSVTVSTSTGNQPDGTVTIKDGSTTVGTITLTPGDPATGSTSISGLAVGSHSLTAVYGGSSTNPGFNASTSSPAISHTVSAATTLKVNASVTNDNGGTKAVSDFVYKIDTTTVTSGTTNTVTATSHTVSVTGTTGYTVTIGGDCASNGSVTLSSGDAKICTVTLNDIAPTLTVNKVVINDSDGTKSASDFTLKIDSTTVVNGNQNTVNAGAHTVSEVADAAYVGTISGDCASNGSITLAPGDVKTCTITNDDIATKLTVNKTALGGDATFDFSGDNGIGPFIITTSGGSASSVVSSLC